MGIGFLNQVLTLLAAGFDFVDFFLAAQVGGADQKLVIQVVFNLGHLHCTSFRGAVVPTPT